MKKTTLVLVALVFVALVTSAYKNEQPGFRGLKWGSPPFEGLGEVVFTDESYGGIEFYEWKDTEHVIGVIPLKSILLGYWQGKLSDVLVEIEGEVNCENMFHTLYEKFGTISDRPNQFMDKYNWYGKVTDIYLDYENVSIKGVGTMRWSSAALTKQQQAWEKAQIKKGAASGF